MINLLRKTVESQFNHPNIALALLFFALPFILQIFFWVIFGTEPNFAKFALGTVAPSLVSWFVSSAIFYVLIFGLRARPQEELSNQYSLPFQFSVLFFL